MQIQDAYTILQVERDATLDDIKKAFRTLALNCHPDKPGGTNEAFQKLKDAYELLSSLHNHKEQNHTRPEPSDPPPPRAKPRYPHPYVFPYHSMFKSSEKDIRQREEWLKMYQQAASEMNDKNEKMYGPLDYEYGPIKNKRRPNHNMLCACNKWLRYDVLGSHRLKCKLVDRTAVDIIATGTISEDGKKIVHPRGEMWLSDIKRAIPHLPQPI